MSVPARCICLRRNKYNILQLFVKILSTSDELKPTERIRLHDVFNYRALMV